MKKVYLLVCGLFLLSLVWCAKVVTVIPVWEWKVNSVTTYLDANKPVQFWVALDVTEYWDFDLNYDIELLQNGKSIGKTYCNALDIGTFINLVETNINDKHNIKYLWKMRCDLMVPEASETTVNIKYEILWNTDKNELRSYDIVIKQ